MVGVAVAVAVAVVVAVVVVVGVAVAVVVVVAVVVAVGVVVAVAVVVAVGVGVGVGVGVVVGVAVGVVSNRERRKGYDFERECARLYERYGFKVQAFQRNREGGLDHLVIGKRVNFVSDAKFQATARPWAWAAEIESRALDGYPWVIPFRRAHSRAYALTPFEDLLRMVSA